MKNYKISLIFFFLILFLLPISTARFIQPDPIISDVYDPQDLNRYTYVRNNPYKYVDPSGNEPVESQIGDYNIMYNQLVQFEAQLTAANGGVAPSAPETLNNLITFAGTYSSQPKAGSFLYNSEARYVYTSEKGFIDNLHFFTAAAQAQKSGALVARLSGVGIELVQRYGPDGYNDHSSAFSYDDLPSNSQGIQYQGQLNNKDPLSAQYKTFIESKGGYTDPKGTLKQENPSLWASIPSSEPADKPSSTKYTSWGRAVPNQRDKSSKNSLFNRFRRNR